jgi:hypothetical protein
LFEFEAVERRSVVACFDGGNIASNAGALLLGQVDRDRDALQQRRRGVRQSQQARRFVGSSLGFASFRHLDADNRSSTYVSRIDVLRFVMSYPKNCRIARMHDFSQILALTRLEYP